MSQKIEIDRLSFSSIYKIVLAGLLFSLIPLCVICGVFALFGFETIKWNGEPVLGFNGLLVSPLIGLMMALIFTAFFGTLCAFGLWVYSKFWRLTLIGKSASVHGEH